MKSSRISSTQPQASSQVLLLVPGREERRFESGAGAGYAGQRDFIPVGIDVSSEKLDVAVCLDDEHTAYLGSFPNTEKGITRLIGSLSSLRRDGKKLHAVMEATGVYYRLAAKMLYESDAFEVGVANPKAAKHFALSLMGRVKTDKADARSLALFAARVPHDLWAPPDPVAFDLREISRRILELTGALTRENNRLHARERGLAPECVIADIEAGQAELSKRIEHLREKAHAIIDRTPRLSGARELLLSIKGVGEINVIGILAELATLPPGLSAKQWVAMAGLDPKTHESGGSVRKKSCTSKMGNKHLRHSLFLAALVCSTHDSNARAWKTRLVEVRHKTKKQAVVAVMRKLLVGIHAMLRTRTTFNSALLFPPHNP